MTWKRSLALWLAATLIASAAAIPAAAAAPLKVMTFNVRLPLAQDGLNAWEHRRDIALATVARESPDIVATQELFKEQGDYLAAGMPDYAWFGVGRRGGDADEHMGILYRRDRFKLWHSGNFWLSDTPGMPGSITMGNLYPRMVTWGLFERTADRRRFYVVNTHFPYRPEDEERRRRSAAMIAAWIAMFPSDMPVVLLGDFNETPGNPAYRILTSSLRDAWIDAPVRSGPAETFHAFTGKPDRRIDWILTRGLRAENVRTIEANFGGRYPSDHFPVVATLAWERHR